MSINVGAVRSADASEPSSKVTPTGGGALGAFSVLLHCDESDLQRHGINLNQRPRHRETASSLGSRRTQAESAATSGSGIDPSAVSAMSVAVQPAVPTMLGLYRGTQQVATIAEAADGVSGEPLIARSMPEQYRDQKTGDTQLHPQQTSFGSMRNAVARDRAESDSAVEESVSSGDLLSEAGAPSLAAPGADFPPVAHGDRSTGTTAADRPAAESLPTASISSSFTPADSPQIELASTFDQNSRPKNQQTDATLLQSLPDLQAGSPGATIRPTAASAAAPPARSVAAQSSPIPLTNDELEPGNNPPSGLQIGRSGPGSGPQHRDSSSQSTSSGSGMESQRVVERGSPDPSAFTTSAQFHPGTAVAQPAHNEAHTGASPSLPLAMQHALEVNQAKALQNSMRDLRVNIQTQSFGRVTVQAVTESGQLSAQVLLENSKQSAVLAGHLPALEEKLTQHYGMNASVTVAEGWDQGSGGAAGRHHADSSPNYEAHERSSGPARSPAPQFEEPRGLGAVAQGKHGSSILDVTV